MWFENLVGETNHANSAINNDEASDVYLEDFKLFLNLFIKSQTIIVFFFLKFAIFKNKITTTDFRFYT